MRALSVTLLLAILFSAVQAQEPIEVKSQFRYRYESVQKDVNQETMTNNYNLLRSRVGLRFNTNENVSVFFQIQDSRILGEEASTMDGTADQLDMHQAYLNFSNPFDLPVSVKLGRYETKYANERLIGAVGWHNIGRSFDGVTLSHQMEKGNVSLFGYKVSESLRDNDEDDLNFYGVWGNLQLCERMNSDLFVLWRKQFGTDRLNEFTLGTNLNGTLGPLKGTLELAYQTGQLDANRDIYATMVAVNLNYKLEDVILNPSVLAGIDYLSGDNDPADDKYKVFNTLYATNHKFYGIMDFFLNIPAHTAGYGLTDINLGASFKLTEQVSGVAKIHRFYSSEEYQLADGNESTFFGDELDVVCNYQFDNQIKLQLGGGAFVPGEIFDETHGSGINLFMYTSILANL